MNIFYGLDFMWKAISEIEFARGLYFKDFKSGNVRLLKFLGKELKITHLNYDSPVRKSHIVDLKVEIWPLENKNDAEEILSQFHYHLFKFLTSKDFSFRSNDTFVELSKRSDIGPKARALLAAGDSLKPFFESVNNYSRTLDINRDSLCKSMKLFALAKVSGASISTLILLMSAVECLAEQEIYGEPIGKNLEELLRVFDSNPIEDKEVFESLKGRIVDLKRESVRRSIIRLCRKCKLSEEDITFVDKKAYSVRSKLLHDGKIPDDYYDVMVRLHGIVLRIFNYIQVDIES
ncbi:MAG: hypothetical protein LAT65_05810 [Saccharospirillum sp.]|nr:hypothetical protein [Saccharospirillum sp.]